MRVAYVVLPLLLTKLAVAEPAVVLEVNSLQALPATSAPAGLRRAAWDEAAAVMAQRCALCHGSTGRSDGVMSTTLKPRPRDLSDAAWQRSVSDDHIKKAVLEGGVAVGKSAIMPANPDLRQKPAVLDELVRIIRGFSKRGVVRASVVGEDGSVLAQSSAQPDASGAKAALTLAGVKPGTVTLRGYFDANENAQHDADERSFSKDGVVVTDGPVTVEVDLAAARTTP